MTYSIHRGDCLDILPMLPAQSVDAIIADPPYGTTACKWDSVIPLEPMWRELKRVIKPRGAVVLFAAQPFTSALVMSNAGWFKYAWTWDKRTPAGFQIAKVRPMMVQEDIAVFCDASPIYNPQMTKREKPKTVKQKHYGASSDSSPVKHLNDNGPHTYTDLHPKSILSFASVHSGSLHPTQKPVELLCYLVRTYTNAGETVLDFTMGSGTTGVACAMEGRHFVGIELDADYCEIARRRIESVQPTLLQAAD